MSKKTQLIRRSKFLSLILRHKPETIGLKLDDNGWANVKELSNLSKISETEIKKIVDSDDKKRYTYNNDGSKIRACQGHSLNSVSLELKPSKPPKIYIMGQFISF